MTDKVPLTRAQLEERLWDQVDLNRASAESFDDGTLAEARRIAVGLRVLLHDTKVSHSLLGQLGVKESLNYVDTAIAIDPKNLLTTSGLTLMQIRGGQAEWKAPLGDGPPQRYQNPFSPGHFCGAVLPQ